MQLDAAEIQCPYCGERLFVEVDYSAGPQSYIEDCQVCCCPIELQLSTDGEHWQLQARRDDE